MADAKWYIVHAYSNFEKKVASAIREQAEMQDLSELFEEIEVPTEEVVEVVRGKKRTTERRYFPGYVLVKMRLTDAAYHLVKNTPKVTGFLGAEGGKKPLPVPQREVDRILGQAVEDSERPRPTIAFEVGEKIKVTDIYWLAPLVSLPPLPRFRSPLPCLCCCHFQFRSHGVCTDGRRPHRLRVSTRLLRLAVREDRHCRRFHHGLKGA